MLPVSMYATLMLQATLVAHMLWYALTFAACQFYPLALFPGVLLVAVVHFLRVPPPPKARLEKILGRDLHLIDPANSDNNNHFVRTVAHRGAGLDAPENSLIAFQQCEKEGCMFIEFDVALSKDGIPVVFHDPTLERVANDKRFLAKLLLKELQDVDIAANHPFKERYAGTNIPTLDATVKQLLAAGQKMFIDIKDCDMRMVPVITNLFQTFPTLYDNAVVTTFFPSLIYGIRKTDPKIVCSLAYRPYFFCNQSYSSIKGVGPRRFDSFWRHSLAVLLDALHSWALPRVTYYFIGLSAILLHKDSVSPQIIQQWRDKGVRPCIWTINKPIDKQYVSKTLQCTYLTDTLVGENSVNMLDIKPT